MDEACNRALEHFQSTAHWQEEAAQTADTLLEHVVQRLSPDQEAWEQRNAAIQRVNAVLKGMPDFLPDHLRYQQHSRRNGSSNECLAQLLLFGSFCSGLWHKASDLDLTITGRWRNTHGQLLDMATMLPQDLLDMLYRILRALLAAGVATSSDSQPAQVIRARVPLIAFVDAQTGIAVDISVQNHGGVFKSNFTRELSQFDARFVSLYRLVKLWASVHGLNDPKSGTLNSWSITQMVLFHLQVCHPAVLPPLWQFFHSEPPTGPRPVDQEAGEDNPSSRSSSTTSSSRGRNGGFNPRQMPRLRAGAPYELLEVCAAQRGRIQPLYNQSTGGFTARPLPLLVGFLVRFREVMYQWCEVGQHRSVKLSTWLGRWNGGGQQWRQDYLASIEDPFDTSDNTARTLGTGARNDGGSYRLLDELTRATAAMRQLCSTTDVDNLMVTLFNQNLSQMEQPGYGPVVLLTQQQQQRQQQQQQRQQQQQ